MGQCKPPAKNGNRTKRMNPSALVKKIKKNKTQGKLMKGLDK